jgi:hypothetical protein
MKRFWWILLITPLFLQFQSKHGNFAGTWELDLKKSVNLPPSFKSVDSFILDIALKGDSMTVVANMKGKGQTVPFPPYVYVLDGKETYRKDTLRGSERWMKAAWGTDGKSVVMDTRASITPPGKPTQTFSQHDAWTLVGDTLIDITITQKMQGPDSLRSERRFFRKLK